MTGLQRGRVENDGQRIRRSRLTSAGQGSENGHKKTGHELMSHGDLRL
tara:strand:- start:31 stop:174 length:144 start_codon:yes stop_codon:yes gene_type:complete